MFDWAYALEVLPDLLRGFMVTLQATLLGMLLALMLGLVWTILQRGNRIVSLPIFWFVQFIRSTPLLVQIFFLFFVLPGFGLVMSPLVTGVLALGLHYSTYTAEVYRAGIEAVPRGQWEAARALNFKHHHIWRAIILPQALPPIVPALGNYLIAMFKDSPMLAAITVLEVLQTAKLVGSEHFRYLEPLTLAGLLFLIVSLIASRFIYMLEVRFGQH